jgi:hypothetical protein
VAAGDGGIVDEPNVGPYNWSVLPVVYRSLSDCVPTSSSGIRGTTECGRRNVADGLYGISRCRLAPPV